MHGSESLLGISNAEKQLRLNAPGSRCQRGGTGPPRHVPKQHPKQPQAASDLWFSVFYFVPFLGLVVGSWQAESVDLESDAEVTQACGAGEVVFFVSPDENTAQSSQESKAL